MYWWQSSSKGGVCFQGCPKASTKRDNVTQRCFCDASTPCLPGLTCLSISPGQPNQCVNCAPLADPQCFDQDGLVAFLNKQPVDPTSAKGYSLVPVHVWAYNVSQLAEVVDRLAAHVEVVSPSELAALIHTNVKPAE